MSVKANSMLYNRDAVPEFSNDGRCTVVTHREFIQDIRSSSAFNSTTFRINPGLFATFPWLASIGANYEQWVCQGLIFEFKTTSATAIGSTSTALGTVIGAVQYNSLAPVFANKQQMENYEFAQSTVPSQSMIVPVECSPKQTQCGGIFNVRSQDNSSIDDDPRLYDLGRFTIATQGMQAENQVLGELWVSYKICFMKPRQYNNMNTTNLWLSHGPVNLSSNVFGTDMIPNARNDNSFCITTYDGLGVSDSVAVSSSFIGVLKVEYVYNFSSPSAFSWSMPVLNINSINCPMLMDVGDFFQYIESAGNPGRITGTLSGSSNYQVHAVYYVACNGGKQVAGPSQGFAPVFALTSGTQTNPPAGANSALIITTVGSNIAASILAMYFPSNPDTSILQ